MDSFLGNLQIGQSFIANRFWWVFVLLIIWSLVWKGFALWKSARLSHKKWFIAILILNTFGILEIVYLFFIGRDYSIKVEEEKEELGS